MSQVSSKYKNYTLTNEIISKSYQQIEYLDLIIILTHQKNYLDSYNVFIVKFNSKQDS